MPQQDVTTLQDRLNDLIRIAKSNERKQLNFQQYELSLLNSSGLEPLLKLILEEHKHRFQLTAVTLMLHDPEYEFQRLLESFPETQQWQDHLLFTESVQRLEQFFSLRRTPRLVTFSQHQHQQLFPSYNELGSIALLPLIRQNQLIGSLNLGSRNPNRFQSNIGTQFLEHLAAVVSACIENARLHEEVKLVGLRDPLTGVNNRRFFDQRISEEFSRANRNRTPLSCLFVDLDYFKRINDSHGHQTGDQVLKHVAQLLNDSLRQGDVLARYGGEEFVVLLADASRAVAADIAERMRKTVAETDFTATKGKIIRVTLSVGVSTLEPGSNMTIKRLLQSADQAVYGAKLSGRNQVKVSAEA
jgi:diguanylate cyclase (GGDEF)-like protein